MDWLFKQSTRPYCCKRTISYFELGIPYGNLFKKSKDTREVIESIVQGLLTNEFYKCPWMWIDLDICLAESNLSFSINSLWMNRELRKFEWQMSHIRSWNDVLTAHQFITVFKINQCATGLPRRQCRPLAVQYIHCFGSHEPWFDTAKRDDKYTKKSEKILPGGVC